MLKKQTVWLLTMLSLVIVLSVYYLNAEPASNDVANNDNGQTENNGEKELEENTDGEVETEITQITRDEAFEAIRIQKQDERSRKLEELETVAASTDLSASERSIAVDEMERINEMAEKEKTLEMLIVSSLGYEDALVRADDGEVRITVKGQEPSRTNANEIIRMVKEEMDTTNVTVAFQTEDETK